jgi:molybdenum cofactor sulfurtransferase
MNGERLPLDWPRSLRFSLHHPDTYTLLDAAALVSTTPLDLSNHLLAPDFVAISFYKIFGFPDLGALIVRKASGHVFDKRKYFGGGTTEMTTCIGDTWVVRKQSSLHARLEDGTIAIRSILALNCAIETHDKLFGGLEEVSKHTGWLAKVLHKRLMSLRHFNGAPVCQSYKPPSSTYGDTKTQGATVAFNVLRSDKSCVGPWHVGAMLRANGIHVRTGTLCNPAGIACALGVNAEWLRRAFDEGFRCNTEADILEGVPVGVVRVTLGAMSTMEDVEKLMMFLYTNFVEHGGDLQANVSSRIERKDSIIGSREPSELAESLEAQENLENSNSKNTQSVSKTRTLWRRWEARIKGHFG